jgi:hypothetical protein
MEEGQPIFAVIKTKLMFHIQALVWVSLECNNGLLPGWYVTFLLHVPILFFCKFDDTGQY